MGKYYLCEFHEQNGEFEYNHHHIYSDEFLNYHSQLEYLKKDLTKEEQFSHRIRKLTPSEALKLQGFEIDFYFNACKAGISNHQLYKQAGNAVSVNTVYAILNFLYKNEIIKL